jgi:hypothetical protein
MIDQIVVPGEDVLGQFDEPGEVAVFEGLVDFGDGRVFGVILSPRAIGIGLHRDE